MTEEEFKKAMTKTIVFIVIMIILFIVVAILVFNKSGKSTSIFENDKQKSSYENNVNEVNSYNITKTDSEEINENSEENNNQEYGNVEEMGNQENQNESGSN